jgi:hypothetical protein
MLAAVTLPVQLIGLAGLFYFITLPSFTVSERIFGKQQRRLADLQRVDGEVDN